MRALLLTAAFCAIGALAQDSFDSVGLRVAVKIYEDCSKADGFSPCLKKKALTILDRVSRMEKLNIVDGVTLVKSKDVENPSQPAITEDQLEQSLPRAIDAKDDALNDMLYDKVSNFVSSRTVEVSMPRMLEEIEEARGGGGGGGGGGGKGGGGKGGKGGGMMGGMMMAIAAKMAALIPIAIAGLFLLAGKALITAKIALLISGIIAIKKLFASKNQGHGHSSGWQSGGGGGGGGGGAWQSSGGGWDKRSYNEIQNMAYKGYKQE